METTFDIQAPHEAALALLKGKKPVASEVFKGLLPELRARAFTVSGVCGAGTLQLCRDAIAGIAEGETWDDAKKALVEQLDPWLGDGAPQRAELLLRTHGFQAFSAASHQTAMEDPDTTHFQYLTMEDDRVRESHAALDGVVLPKDDPFWLTHTPPWDFGCRCLKRSMNEDQVDDEKESDKDKNPEDKNVITGPALTQLNHGTLIRNGQRYDVTPPKDGPDGKDAYQFHPDNLRLPIAQLEQRYDPDVWSAFKKWASATDIEKNLTVWDWLTENPPTAPAAPAAPEPNEMASKLLRLKMAKFSGQIQEEAQALPPKPVELLSNADFAITRGGAHYSPSTRTINLQKNPAKWSGEPQAFHHECGHHIHYQTGIVKADYTRPDFKEAIAADMAGFKKWAEAQYGPGWQNTFKRTNLFDHLNEIAKHLGYSGFDSNDTPSAKRVSRIADTISGLSQGKYGSGHQYTYMLANGDKEVFAHAYSALIQGDETFKKLFPNVVNVVKKELAL